MAGLGRRVFSAGEVLTAANVNGYLMDQSVMVFADSTARSSAIAAPSEGMVTYLEDDNQLYKWTGADWENVNDNSNAILKSTVTTTGDLIVADGNASVTRLGIGSNGQVLSSNGTTATWTTPSSGGQTLITSTTLSGVTTTISGISQTYKDLKIIVQDIQGGGSAPFNVTPRITLHSGANDISVRTTAGTFIGWATALSQAGLDNMMFAYVSNYSGSNNYSKPILNINRSSSTAQNHAGSTADGDTGGIDVVKIVDQSGVGFTGGNVSIWGVA